MDEAEWLTCTDPQPMLEFLLTSGQASDRKLRLFAAACCRTVWEMFKYEKGIQAAVWISERFADGLATAMELQSARSAAEADAYDSARANFQCLVNSTAHLDSNSL